MNAINCRNEMNVADEDGCCSLVAHPRLGKQVRHFLLILPRALPRKIHRGSECVKNGGGRYPKIFKPAMVHF